MERFEQKKSWDFSPPFLYCFLFRAYQEEAESLLSLGGDERLHSTPLGFLVEALLEFKQVIVLILISKQLSFLISILHLSSSNS